MQKFQDSNHMIIITDVTGKTFICPSTIFPSYEETYHAVSPDQVRVWTPAVQYIAENGNQHEDPFYTPELFARYVSNIIHYQARYDADHQPHVLTFEQTQAAALTTWNQDVNQFITHYFDAGTQISFVKLYIQHESARPLIAQVDAWVTAVMGYYYTVKAQLQAATTIAAITALQPALEFDSRFGDQGSVCAVPNIHLSQFF